MLDSKKIVLITFPALTVLAGGTVLLTGYIDYQKELRDIENLFAAHADSLAGLLAEGAREASASTSLIYEITEDHLSQSAHLLAAAEEDAESDAAHLMKHHGVSVLLSADDAGVFDGHWGGVPPDRRSDLVSWMVDSEEGVLVDDGPVESLGLACLAFHAPSKRPGIVCLSAARLAAMRREIGIGPLLQKVIQKDVRYVVLEDLDGPIAAAPPNEPWAPMENDALLGRVLNKGVAVSRTVLENGRPIFERLVPFDLPDESRAALRVGIDGTVPAEVRRKATRRFWVTLVAVSAVTLVTIFLAALAWARSRKAETMERRLAAEQAEKRHWADLGQMAATVAHEVRNPLNTIGMVSQRLKAELEVKESDRPEFDEMMSLLLSESKRVGRVVTEFLDLGKPLVLAKEQVSVQTAVEEAVLAASMRATTEEKRIEFDAQCETVVELDRNRFRQLLSNVLDNALDAMEGGGTVRVATLREKSNTIIRVADDGKGMTAAELETVMKPFVSFKKTGTGLGLPLVKRIAEAHGGEVRLTSETGRGTVVEIRMPGPSVRGE